MSFDGYLIAVGTGPTQLYQCPAAYSGAIHSLVLFNSSASPVNVTVSLLNNANGVTNSFAIPVPANSDWVLPKAIDVQSGDTLTATAATPGVITALRSVYLTAPTAAVGFNPRGTWSSIATYALNDVVNLAGSSFVCVTPHTDQSPVQGANTTYWMYLTQQGPAGVPGPRGDPGVTGTFSGTASGTLDELEGAPIAASATLNLESATGNLVHVTGSTTITAIALNAGAERTVVFDGSPTLTYNASSLILPGGVNIVASPGDTMIVRGETGSAARVIVYTPATGTTGTGGVGVPPFLLMSQGII